jgi:predicted transcriptional regulator
VNHKNRYRTRNDIIRHILETASGNETKKTKIMLKVFLSYYQMKEYLTVLTDRDLLRYDLDKQTFKPSEKGLRFLEAYNQMDAVIKA